MGLGFAVDELDRDPHAIGRFAHAAFDDVVHTKFTRDLLRLHRLAFVHENRVAGDHEKFAEPRQFGNDVLGQAVGKKLLLRIAAHVDERKHRDRRFARV
jgi:hypothetical protein